jgi:Fe-S-cluster containining protein
MPHQGACVILEDMPGDEALIRIVDAALAEAARKSGTWLVCRPGCTECCMGPFPITQLDARRLREGLAELEFRDPRRAAGVRERAHQAVARISPHFPGDPATGVLDEDEEPLAGRLGASGAGALLDYERQHGQSCVTGERFAALADEDPCPALDPATGMCDLYAARPITCRIFGPPVRYGSEAVGVCELCFKGASDEEIAACAVEIAPDGLESQLLNELERTAGARGQTMVAFALITAP